MCIIFLSNVGSYLYALIVSLSFLIGLWKRSKFVEVFGAHPALPFGEDIFGGFTTLNKVHTLG